MTIPTRRDQITCLVLLVALGVLAVLTLTTPASGLRMLLVVVVLGAAPGWGLVPLRSPSSVALAWVMAVSASLALSIVVSLTLLQVGWWRPMVGFWGLMALSAVLLSTQLFRTRKGVRA